MKRINASTASMIEVEIFTVPALFTPRRVDRATIPPGLTCYEIRKDPFCVAEQVKKNFYGTLLAPVPLDIPPEGERKIWRGDFIADLTWGSHTAAQFEEKYLSPHYDK